MFLKLFEHQIRGGLAVDGLCRVAGRTGYVLGRPISIARASLGIESRKTVAVPSRGGIVVRGLIPLRLRLTILCHPLVRLARLISLLLALLIIGLRRLLAILTLLAFVCVLIGHLSGLLPLLLTPLVARLALGLLSLLRLLIAIRLIPLVLVCSRLVTVSRLLVLSHLLRRGTIPLLTGLLAGLLIVLLTGLFAVLVCPLGHLLRGIPLARFLLSTLLLTTLIARLSRLGHLLVLFLTFAPLLRTILLRPTLLRISLSLLAGHLLGVVASRLLTSLLARWRIRLGHLLLVRFFVARTPSSHLLLTAGLFRLLIALTATGLAILPSHLLLSFVATLLALSGLRLLTALPILTGHLLLRRVPLLVLFHTGRRV